MPKVSAGPSFPVQPVWLPAHVVALLCGRAFEVLRVDDQPAAAVLEAIGPACGPVIATRLGYHDFLLPPGEFLRQHVPRAPGVRPMPNETRVDVPPLTASPHEGIHWLVPPGTGATDLSAVTTALAGHFAHGGPARHRAPPRRDRR
ncbi:hypothetical protein ABTY61_37625 [Kitasatospora sp. NPDC096128]|uniref:hypothetical protein n=1 Tax=Kitasatospora sp. NPDC096128 TaxID=3155547 RepID=UPI0033305EF6